MNRLDNSEIKSDLSTQVFSLHACEFGFASIVSSATGVCRVELDTDVEPLRQSVLNRYPSAIEFELDKSTPDHASHVAEVLEHIGASKTVNNLFPLDLVGTPFQHQVWNAMREIPFGETTTYQKLATKIGRPGSVRAVANACGANPVAILIPCHRVLRTDGGLGGYRWGVERKRQLLQIEGTLPATEQLTFQSF